MHNSKSDKPETDLFVRLVVLDPRAYRHAREIFPDIVSSELSDAEAEIDYEYFKRLCRPAH